MGICLNVIFDPVDIGCENGHIFCNICIHRLRLESGHGIASTFMCPSCRYVCYPQNIRKMAFIERQIKRLKIKCPNHCISPRMEKLFNANKRSRKRDNGRSRISIPNNSDRSRSRSRSRSREKDVEQKEQSLCLWTGSWGDCNRHLLQCEFEIICCEYCDVDVMKKDLRAHYAECAYYPLRCNKCNDLVRRREMSLHADIICPKQMVLCIEGCGERLLREEQTKHSDVCPEHSMKCEYFINGCNQMIKRKDLDKHMNDAMATHLALVTRQCNGLMNVVANMNARLQQIEQHLGMHRR